MPIEPNASNSGPGKPTDGRRAGLSVTKPITLPAQGLSPKRTEEKDEAMLVRHFECQPDKLPASFQLTRKPARGSPPEYRQSRRRKRLLAIFASAIALSAIVIGVLYGMGVL